MGLPEPHEITLLLRAWQGGSSSALERLTPLVYDELRRMARRYMVREKHGNTLHATALVSEVYLRLVGVDGVDWQGRAHFFAICARLMRRILIDAARTRASRRRAIGLPAMDCSFDLDQLPTLDIARANELIAIHEGLEALARWDARKAQVIELRFFGGLSVEETAEVLKVSPQSIKRDWKLARAWLTRELRRDQAK